MFNEDEIKVTPKQAPERLALLEEPGLKHCLFQFF
jgi:hypothetical protein